MDVVMNAHALNRRQMLAFGAGFTVRDLILPAHAQAATPSVVIELFTSQGCSACPPADAFMQELKSMAGVIAISFHVEYWDYLGWRDTLGDKVYSRRQYDYARWRDDGNVFTPQMIIDGRNYFVGSDKPAVKAAIKRAETEPSSMWVPMTLSEKDHELIVTVDAHRKALKATLWLLAILPSITIKIGRGENAGRDIVYSNVVRNLIPAGMWNGAALNIAFPMENLLTDDGKACVALLQAGAVGPVIGAATLGFST